MTIGKQLSDGNPDGTVLGQDANDMVGFYGIDPAVSKFGTSISGISTASVSIGGSTMWGFSTSAQADAIARLPFILARMGLVTSF